MQLDRIKTTDIPFCCSKGLWREEIEEEIRAKAICILGEIQESGDNFVELRTTPADTAEFLVLTELFWNKFQVKLSPLLNTKNIPVGFTAVSGCKKPNDLEGYYQFCMTPPPPVKVERPKPRPKPKKETPIESKPAVFTLELSDEEIREKYVEIAAKRSYTGRRLEFGNFCYIQNGDKDGSKTRSDGALFYAVQENDYHNVKDLLSGGSNANARDLDGKTPLFHVMHDPEIIRLLIKFGADPNAVDNSGFTPMIVARAYQLYSGNSSFVKTLKDYGAK